MVRFLLPSFLLLLGGCSWEYRYRQEAQRISDWDLSATCWAHSINLSGKEQCMDDLAAPELELCITSLSSKRPSIFAYKNKDAVLQCMEQKGWFRGVYMFVHGA